MNCQQDIKKKFHKFYAPNKIKNAWYSEKRKSINKNKKNEAGPSTQITIESFANDIRNLARTGTTLEPSFKPDTPRFKHPDKMKPCF